MKSRANFAFVANLRSFKDSTSFRLAKGHVLRRATAKEVKKIKQVLQDLAPGPRWIFVNSWEKCLFQGDGEQKILPESEWRYFVIAFRGSNSTVERIREASELAPVEFEIIFTTGQGVIFHPDRLFQTLQELWQHEDDFFTEIGAADVAEIVKLHGQLQHYDSQVLNLRPFLSQLSQLKGLPHRSPASFLGHFALLESLLAHSPNPTDPYDSITRQVKKKLALLDHRWPRKIDYAPFGKTPAERVWQKMYAYRSDLAHGNTPDFKKNLDVLKSHVHAFNLLKETTKAVIRHALEEPQLLVDLREC